MLMATCKDLADVQKDDNNPYPDQDEGFHDHAVTILLVAWGQFIDHDITLTAETKDIRHVMSMLSFLSYHDWEIGDNNGVQLIELHGRTGKTPKCCDGGFGGNHPNCLPIEIPQEDHFYKLHKRRCMNFVRSKSTWIQRKNSIFLPRSQAGLRYNCRLGPREQFNEISAVLDAGTVYSNVPERLESLRCGSFFMMFSTKLFEQTGESDFDSQVVQERIHEDPPSVL